MFETGGMVVHRDTLQSVRDKLVNVPARVEAREKIRVALARTHGKIAKCLDRHSMWLHGELHWRACVAAEEKRTSEATGHAINALKAIIIIGLMKTMTRMVVR